MMTSMYLFLAGGGKKILNLSGSMSCVLKLNIFKYIGMGILGDIAKRDLTGGKRKEDRRIPFWRKDGFVGVVTEELQKMLYAIYDFTGYSVFSPNAILPLDGDVDVILDDKTTRKEKVSRDDIKKTIESLESEVKSLVAEKKLLEESRQNSQNDDSYLSKRIEEICGIIEKLDIKLEGLRGLLKSPADFYEFEVDLLGYYKRRPDPEIHLMMGALAGDAQLAGIVFVHELMHAYFDLQFDSKGEYIGHPSCRSIEEPIAEYGMLCFMEMFEMVNSAYRGILSKAKKYVKDKRFSESCCDYGYGYYLYEDKSDFGADWVSLFHKHCPMIQMNSPEMKAYEGMISPILYPRYERACEVRLYELLRPKRFCFVGLTKYHNETASERPEDMYVKVCSGFENNESFRIEYISYPKGKSTKIRLLIECKDGSMLTGDASFYREPSRFFPRLYISKNLFYAYADHFGKKDKCFAFYEKTPFDGINPAEWVATECDMSL